jgi:hypothetical protein
MKILAVLILAVLCPVGYALAQEVDLRAPYGQPDPQEPEAPDTDQNSPETDSGEQNQETHLDVIFAIDASGSVQWTDPNAFRKTIVNLFIDIIRDHDVDRVAVVQFAGWNETTARGSTVFKLTELPALAQTRDIIVADFKNAINFELESFGAATDFNYAFDVAIQEILDERQNAGSKNKVWLILISDGSMDVVERNEVRAAYSARVSAESKSVNRPNLNEAATEIFLNDTLPKVAALKDMFITCIALGKGEPGEPLVKISELPNAEMLRMSGQNLKSVLLGAFDGLPEDFPRWGIQDGFDYLSSVIEPSSSLSHAFHIYQAASRTRLLLLGSAPGFSIDVVDRDGASIVGRANLSMSGRGDSYRLVDIATEAFGDYSVVVTNESNSPLSIELIESADFDLTVFVDTTEVKPEFYPDETLAFTAQLRESRTSTPITDGVLVSDSVLIYEIRDVDGNVTSSSVAFSTPQDASTRVEYLLPTDAPGGEYELLVSAGILKNDDTGRYAFISKPVRIACSVLSPIVELSFSEQEAFVGQTIRVIGKLTKGSLTEKQKQEGINGKAIHSLSLSEKEFKLSWDGQALTGSMAFDQSSKWKLQKSPLGTGEITPVKPREIRLLLIDKDGKRIPVGDTLKLKGQTGEPALNKLIVEPDMSEGEDAELAASFNNVIKEAQISSSIAGQPGDTAPVTFENSSVPLDVSVKLSEIPAGKDLGELILTLKLSDFEMQKKVLVSIEIPPKPFPWLYVLIGAAVALVLLALVLVLLSGPTFDQQQVYIIGGNGHLLKEWKTGRRSAVGTSEAPSTLLFRLKGGKSSPKCVVMPSKKARAFVNNIECTYWTDLHHGDYIEAYPVNDEYSYRYRYFDRAPLASELQEQAAEREAVFLSEDEFILADDDDMTAVSDATQALLEQARRMRKHLESEGTEVLVPGAADSEEPPVTELVREAAGAPADQDYTEAVPRMPDEATEILFGDSVGAEDVEATQAIAAEDDALFEEITAEEAEMPDLPLSEEVMDSGQTQAISDEGYFEDVSGEATQAIMPESGGEGIAITEPTEEIAEELPVEDLTELVEDRLEMSEFIEEEGEAPSEETGMSLADELDKTFDDILGEEEKDKEI